MSPRVDVRVTGDASGGQAALAATDRSLTGLSRGAQTANTHLGGLGSTLGKIGAGLLAAGGLAGGLRKVGESIQMASSAAETMSKTDQIWGRQSQAIKNWAQTSNTALTETTANVLDMVDGFKLFLGNQGIAGSAGANMSKKLTDLAGDLSSFFDTDVGTAADALTSALKGEMDPLEQFGVSLNDAALKAEALRLGLYNGKGALTPAAKAMATYQLILEQTAQAQGDLTRTQGSASNQMRQFSTNLDEIQTSLGTAFLPLIQRFGPAVNGFLEDLNTKIQGKGFADWLTSVGDAAEKAWDQLKKLGSDIDVDELKDSLGAAGDAAESLAGFAASAVTAFNNLSPQTKENLVLLIAAGGALKLASRNPIIKIGVDLVSSAVSSIASSMASSIASRVFGTSMAVRVTNWPLTYPDGPDGARTTTTGKPVKRTGRQLAGDIGKAGAIYLASEMIPYLVNNLPVSGSLKQQINGAAAVASYTAMGFQMFGPIGGVAGFLAGSLIALSKDNKIQYQQLAAGQAQSDYLTNQNKITVSKQQEQAGVLVKHSDNINTLSESSYTHTQRIGDLQKSKATKEGLGVEHQQRILGDRRLQVQLDEHWAKISSLYRRGQGIGQNNPSIGTVPEGRGVSAYGATQVTYVTNTFNVSGAGSPIVTAREVARVQRRAGDRAQVSVTA